MKRDMVANVSLAILAFCALALTAILVRREFFPQSTPSANELTVTQIANWQPYTRVGHRLGPDPAPVTIVEFSDFECPYCRQEVSALRSVQAAHPHEVAIVYRHFPLEAIHPYARRAALASECAGAQGKFWQFHDTLFAHQTDLERGRPDWRRYARLADVGQIQAFDRCLAQETYATSITTDVAAGDSLGVSATPTFLINDLRFGGSMPRSALDSAVQRALSRRRS